MQYLSAAEYVRFGLGEDTSDDLVVAASALIDAHCRRPSLAVTQYVERMRFARCGSGVQLSYLPLASSDGLSPALVSVRVRLSRPNPDAFHPLAQAAAVFGASGTWSSVDVSAIDVSVDGVLQFTPNLLGVRYDEAEVTYTAGFAVVPDAVKIACAQIVRNAQSLPALNVRKQGIDSMQMEYFSASLLDDDTRRMLQPYIAQRVG